MCVSQTVPWPTKMTLQTVGLLTNHFALQIHSYWSMLLDNVNMDDNSPKFMRCVHVVPSLPCWI